MSYRTMDSSKACEPVSPVVANRQRSPDELIGSDLLSLNRTSDVDDIDPQQLADAQRVLLLRDALHEQGLDSDSSDEITALQRRIVSRHLVARESFFGKEQVAPLDEAAEFAREGRDTFLVIKYMDEAPHIRATVASLLAQVGMDLSRVVIVAVNNNSTDGSDRIVADTRSEFDNAVRLVQVNQSVPGGGSAARYGTDRCIATVKAMCELDDDWSRLNHCRIAVTDGDTIYHHDVLATMAEIFDNDPEVDGVMPFLIYKLTAALRFFHDHRAVDAEQLASLASGFGATRSPVSLSTIQAQSEFPRNGRVAKSDCVRMNTRRGDVIDVPYVGQTPDGRRFGVLEDADGARAFVIEDGNLVLHRQPVTGYDAALVALRNGEIRRDEQWKWHTVIGHDLFLLSIFRDRGLPVSLVAPDTSDALKMFRCWAFSIGGQHQLSKPGFKIVTGTDYQSGRILQSVGCVTTLGTAAAWSETEVDRLAKMIRNFANEQSVFYGETRSRGLDRASGLYLHMTRIQGQIESEVREYSDEFYRDVAFPERVVFPLRWLVQNAVSFYASGSEETREFARQRLFEPMFGKSGFAEARQTELDDATMEALRALPFEVARDRAEEIAEAMISKHYGAIMSFYSDTLASFFQNHDLDESDWLWLLEGVADSRNALAEERPRVDPTSVWTGQEFVIDEERGQVVEMSS